MLFSSPIFAAFFIVFFVVYTWTPMRYRLLVIILGSTFFYGYWNIYYTFFPHLLMLLAFFGTIWMVRVKDDERKRRLLLVVVALLTPLFVVKYTAFFYNSILSALDWESVRWQALPLPLGISFVTFTLIAYVVDVYRGRYAVERRVSMLAGLVLFFPHLIAGPILRPADLLPQINRPRLPRRMFWPRISYGIAIFTLGLLKKLVIADPLAVVVDSVFRSGGPLYAQDYWIAVNAFAAEIYCDFSGYTDMAIAIAMMIGIRLPGNFDRPYLSRSPIEFWRRWHITLSTWLRDYLYIPLGGNRLGFARQIANLMATMTLGGLWHGANWTFVLWGLMHGTGLALNHAANRFGAATVLSRIPGWVKMAATYVFVLVGWVWFRAQNIESGVRVLVGSVTAPWQNWSGVFDHYGFELLLFALFILLHRFDNHRIVRRAVRRTPGAIVWPIIGLIWVLAVAVSQGSSAKFVYFDF
ncbi:alginate O-acetyltransferase complex protein AlgI [Rhizobiales bacterium GAS188]|nr:alginate O-acetyltransferase complex protein AlgI [Rhizobiales bacterium GAS188]